MTSARRRQPVTYADVLVAQRRLMGVASRTPVLRSGELDDEVRTSVLLKAEQHQVTGSFKFRGAYNAAVGLDPSDGFCTVSSGNHGVALAACGRILGAPVVVHMPSDAPAPKVAAVRRAGGHVILFDRYVVPQAQLADTLRRDGPGRYISAHDDARVIAGAATVALELVEEAGELEALLVPVGGGGCLAGSGIVCRRRLRRCRVIGVEPELSSVNRMSLRAGRPVTIAVPHTIADGQTLTAPGILTFSIMRRVVDDVVVVTENEIVEAMSYLQLHCGAAVEPSGATGVAALLAGKLPRELTGRRVGVLLTGGNAAGARRLSALQVGG